MGGPGSGSTPKPPGLEALPGPSSGRRNLRHGGWAVARRGLGALTGLDRQDLLEDLEHLREQLIADRGGEVTAAEALIIDDVLRLEAVATLILEYVGSVGVGQLDRDGNPDLVAPLKSLCVYLNSKRLNLMALGLERRARDVTDMAGAFKRLREEPDDGP